MGADGTVGIRSLKQKKKAFVVAQDQETSVIYGMPRSVVKAGLADEELALSRIADCIVEKVGVENKD